VKHFMSVRKIEKMPTKWLCDKSVVAPVEAGVTLFTDRAGNMETAAVEIAADFAGANIRTQIVAKEKRKEMGKAVAIEGHRYPYFQLSDKVVMTEGAAIARTILRQKNSAKAVALLGGESAFAQAKVD